MKAQKAMPDVKSDFKDAMHSVHEGFSDLREGFTSAAGHAGEAGSVAIQSTKNHIEEGIQSVKSIATDLLDCTAKKIGQSPMTSVLVAAGIGFLSGYLISRK